MYARRAKRMTAEGLGRAYERNFLAKNSLDRIELTNIAGWRASAVSVDVVNWALYLV